MADSQQLDSAMKGKDLEMECIRYALYREGIESVFRTVDAAANYQQLLEEAELHDA